MLEQNMQKILMQKQAFEMELSETESAIEEIENSDKSVFKIIGQMMIETEKSGISEEMKNRKRIIELRLKSLDKQEEIFMKKLEKNRENLTEKKDK